MVALTRSEQQPPNYARLVLRDIAGLDDERILDAEQWAAQALLAAALAEERPRSRR